MCPVYGVTTSGNGAVASPQQQQVGGVSGGASGARGLSTASGDKGAQAGVTTGARSEAVDSKPLTASVLAAEQSVLRQSPKVVSPAAGARARKSAPDVDPCGSAATRF